MPGLWVSGRMWFNSEDGGMLAISYALEVYTDSDASKTNNYLNDSKDVESTVRKKHWNHETTCAAILQRVPCQFLIEAPSMARFVSYNERVLSPVCWPKPPSQNEWWFCLWNSCWPIAFHATKDTLRKLFEVYGLQFLHVLPFSQLSWVSRKRVPNQGDLWTSAL